MKKNKKRKFQIILVLSFIQGFFFSTLISFGAYEIKVLPLIKEQNQQIKQLKGFIEHIQNHLRNSQNKNKEEQLTIFKFENW